MAFSSTSNLDVYKNNLEILGDKTPEYEMDPIDGRVFFMKSDTEIICYKF